MRKKIVSNVSYCLHSILYVFIFVVVATILFILLVPKKRESFQLQTPLMSSRQLYQVSDNYEADLLSRFTTMSDNDDMLIMAGCYQLPLKGSNAPRLEDCFMFGLEMYTASFEDVRVRIVEELQKIKSTRNRNIPLVDPAYVIIGQAPYMRDESGNIITMQYNVRSYGLNPVNVMRTGATVDEFKKPLLFKVFVILAAYYGNMSRRPTPIDVKTPLLPFRSKKDQCYISCIGDVTNSYCGCVNTTQRSSDPKTYSSKCSSTPLPVNGVVDTTKNEEFDFAIMYAINPRSSVLLKAGVFA
jgi:hypothetical protein